MPNRKRISNTRKNRGRPASNLARLSGGPSFKGQAMATIRLQGTPQYISTTVTTGLIAVTYNISNSNVTDWTARFVSTFDEFRIINATIRIIPIANNEGVSKIWFDEKQSPVPVLKDSQERIVTTIPNTNASFTPRTLKWKARDLLDLEYTDTSATATPCYFKVFSNNANYGSPITAVGVWLLESNFTVQFRGLNTA